MPASKAQEIENIRIPILGSPLNRSSDSSKDQRFVNGYFWALKNEVTGKPTYFFVKRPGLSVDSQPSGGAATGRGAISWNGKKYTVFNNKIYSNTTDLGVTLPGSSGRVSFAMTRPGATTQYLGINDGTNLYLVTTSDTVVVLNNKAITSSSVANPTVITATGHGLATGNKVIIRGHTGSTPDINGTIYTVTVTGANTFTIPVNVSVGGTGGTIGVFPSPNVGDLEFVDGYWVVMKTDGTVWSCDVDDPTLWDPTKFLTAQMYSGDGVGLARQANFLIILSSTSSQAFYDNANSTGSPFNNYESGVAQIGCISRESIVGDEGSVIWVGNSDTGGHSIWKLDGITNPEEIATTPIRVLLDAEGSTLPSCYADLVRVAGKKFYILSLITLDRTLVYDFDTKMWTEFESSSSGHRLPVASFFEHNHALYAQSTTTGQIFLMSPSVYQDISVNFTVLARFGRVDFDTMQRKFVQRYEFIGDKQPTTTTVNFQYSDDDYVTLSTARSVDMSQVRPFLPQGGNFRRRAHQISYTGNGPLRLEGIELFYRLGI